MEGFQVISEQLEQNAGVFEKTSGDEEDSVEESLAEEAITNEPLTSIENTEVKNAGTRKKSSEIHRQKKIRENRLLRKAILPRNALMALNELKGITIGECFFDGAKSTATVTVNGTQYVGHGTSKMAAKHAACEKALCEFMSNKLKAMPLDGEAEEASNPDDDQSMLNLASFAIHKLFTEWERKGYPLPSILLPDNVKPKPAVVNSTELPNGWESMHPVTVLCRMRPDVAFLDVEASGDLQDSLKCVRVTVDKRSFKAKGKSKKLARRMAAIEACNALFGTNFTYTDTA